MSIAANSLGQTTTLSVKRLPDPKSPQMSNAQCPICKRPISPELLRNFSKSSGISWEFLFCTGHKKNETRLVWKKKGYPEIDWPSLYTRIPQSFNYLEEVLNGTHCYFGDLVWRDIEAGKEPDQIASDCSPGYYGPRVQSYAGEYIRALLESTGEEGGQQ